MQSCLSHRQGEQSGNAKRSRQRHLQQCNAMIPNSTGQHKRLSPVPAGVECVHVWMTTASRCKADYGRARVQAVGRDEVYESKVWVALQGILMRRDAPNLSMSATALRHSPNRAQAKLGAQVAAQSSHSQSYPPRPNPSLNRTRYGRPPWPGLRYAVHFLSPGQGVLPPRAG
jgi:hypothetical protein